MGSLSCSVEYGVVGIHSEGSSADSSGGGASLETRVSVW